MKKCKYTPLRAALSAFAALAVLLGIADYCIEDSVSLRSGDTPADSAVIRISPNDAIAPVSTHGGMDYTAKLFGVLPLKSVSVKEYEDIRLCPGGMPFGAKMFTEGLIVVGFTEIDCTEGSRQPAYDAGIRPQDIILEINGEPVTSAEGMAESIGAGDGSPLEIKIRRGQEILRIPVTPSLSISDNQYKTGMWVRDNTAGIGTITFIDPDTGAFAGLGHGICDTQTGALLPLSRGIIVDVTINGIQKGTSGVPGELKGYFASGKQGTLLGNSDAGVFGVLTTLPDTVCEENALPIALKNEIHDGKAQIYCTLDESGIQAYDVTVRKIKNSLDNKNMEVTVTDPVLLEKTGGIVQGMSGSPILQDGKLIGAVTHVLINDPTKGYGIFIENMLAAAE